MDPRERCALPQVLAVLGEGTAKGGEGRPGPAAPGQGRTAPRGRRGQWADLVGLDLISACFDLSLCLTLTWCLAPGSAPQRPWLFSFAVVVTIPLQTGSKKPEPFVTTAFFRLLKALSVSQTSSF